MYIIGIAGGSGSGKTTFAQKLIKEHIDPHELSILHMDSYYLPGRPQGEVTANFDHPDAFDWDLLRYNLEQLKRGEDVHAPVYDFKSSSRTQQTTLIKSSPVIIFEGIFTLFDKVIRDLLDIKVFLHVEADIRFTRRLNRDVKERGRELESIIEQYYATVRPMHQKFLEPQKQFADFIVGEETDIAAGILSAKIKDLIINLKQEPLIQTKKPSNDINPETTI
jgi:uridine kinase